MNQSTVALLPPPYYGLRDCGHDGQIGLETSVDEYIERLLAVFKALFNDIRKTVEIQMF